MKKYRHLRGTLFDIERELRSRNSGADEAISEAFGNESTAKRDSVSSSRRASQNLHNQVKSGMQVDGKAPWFNDFKKLYETTIGTFTAIAEEIFQSAVKNDWSDRLKKSSAKSLIPLAPYMIFNRRKKGKVTDLMEKAREEEKALRKIKLEKLQSQLLLDFYQGPEYNGEGLLPPDFIEADEKGKGKMLESLIGEIFKEDHHPKKAFNSGASQIIIEPAFKKILGIFNGWGRDYNFVAPTDINDKIIRDSFDKAETSGTEFPDKAKAFIQAIEKALGMQNYWLSQYVEEPTEEEKKEREAMKVEDLEEVLKQGSLKGDYQNELSIYTIKVTPEKLSDKYHFFTGGEDRADAKEWIPLGVTTGGTPEAGIPKMKLDELHKGLESVGGYTLTKHTVTMINEQFIMKDTKLNLEQKNGTWNVVSSES